MANRVRQYEGGDYDERMEVHDGQLVPKEAARPKHCNAQRGITVAVGAPFHRKTSGRGGPGGWWIMTEPEVSYSNWTFLHDLGGWRRDRVPVMPSVLPVREPPDWVCEILSTNRKHDTITKFDVLGTAGVGHYWLIDVEARELVVHRREATGWTRVGAFIASEPGERARIEPFAEIEIELGLLFGDDPDESSDQPLK